MQWHPFAEKFPLLEGEERVAFDKSIKATGGNEQPILFRMKGGKRQGLDGRNRERSCLDQDIKPTYKLVSVKDDEVKDYILRRNVHRRHMSRELRQAIVSELRADGESTRQIAEVVGVSHATVQRDLASTGTNVPVETGGKVVGKDQKERSPTKSPILCDRCKRAQPGVGIEGCGECRRLRNGTGGPAPTPPPPKPQREPGDDTEEIERELAEEKARPKNGSALWDWKVFDSAFGQLVREIDRLGNAYRQKETPAAEALRRTLSDYHRRFKEWHKELTRGKKP